MVLNLITFFSSAYKLSSIQAAHETLLSELETYFTVNLVEYQHTEQLGPDDFKLVFLATSDVERLVVQHFESLPHPVVMLADGVQNSLSAALELASWLRKRGIKNEILHSDLPLIIERIKTHYKNFKAQRSLQGLRIGVIGTPSPSLISSSVDYLLAKRRWGVEYVDISLDRVYQLYQKITDDEVGSSCAAFASQALACREATPEDLLKAMRFYRAIRKVCKEEQLSALTLSCTKLIELTGTTGCLALSLLNDEGIIAGCKGDLQSIFTLLVSQQSTKQKGFMASPALINSQKQEVVFAHCTLPTKLADRYIIRSNFESGSGISIQGLLSAGEVTLIRCGNESLDEYYLSTGFLIENTNYLSLCRTQIRVKMDIGVEYFLKRPLGNYHIILPGNYEDSLNDFLQSNGCKLIQ